MSNIVAIVGRPNVGKSTLFNRLTDSRKAIVDEIAGVTRDRHYGKVEWNGRIFTLIDTGGYIHGSDDVFEDEIRKQVQIAINEADIILFVVDVKVGITDLDEEVAEILRRSKKKILVVSNKVDNHDLIAQSGEFYSFGLADQIFNISSANGAGTGELLDEVVKHLKDEPLEIENPVPRFAIVGRPNVGKSSFLNTLLGEDRNIVTPIAGTTRDTIDTHFTAFGHDFILVDTAGIRKKGKVHEDLEFYSVMRSVKAIEGCDVCLLMLDATQGIEQQDLSIFQLAINNRKGVVVLINKWDLVEKDDKTNKEYEETVRKKLAPFNDVPILFVSTITKQRLLKAVEVAVEVYHNRVKRIATKKLNDVMLAVIDHYPPPAIKGRNVGIKFVKQLPTHAPSFAFYCNLPQYINDSYVRYLENKLREHFNFTGVPIQLFMRKK